MEQLYLYLEKYFRKNTVKKKKETRSLYNDQEAFQQEDVTIIIQYEPSVRVPTV